MCRVKGKQIGVGGLLVTQHSLSYGECQTIRRHLVFTLEFCVLLLVSQESRSVAQLWMCW